MDSLLLSGAEQGRAGRQAEERSMDNALTQRMPERVSLEFLFSFWLVLCKFVVHTCKDRDREEEENRYE